MKQLIMLLFAGLQLLFTSTSFAENQHGKTLLTMPIKGNPPYINSISALIDSTSSSIFDIETKQPILSTGTQLYIPTLLCQSPQITLKDFPFLEAQHFEFLDADHDQCLTQEGQLEWFILETGNKDWNTITSWDELLVTPISPTNLSNIFSSIPTITPILRVPESAVGKRIGFTYTPYSETGVPNKGQPIRAWDLNYFFSQTKPDINHLELANEGTKNRRVTHLSAGGIVEPSIKRPQIEKIKLTGKLLPDETLHIHYNFIANTDQQYEDRSFFCWGKEGKTYQIAEADWSNCTEEPISPPITLNDLQEGLELSIRSAKSENNQLILGDIYTTHILEHDDIYVAPEVSDIAIFYYSTESNIPPENGVQPSQLLGGSYTFLAGSSLIDNSTLSWHINDEPAHKSLATSPADILNNKLRGSFPSYQVRDVDLGNVLKLTVHPKDGNQRQGKNLTEIIWTPLPPSVDNLQFGGNFFVGNELFAEYDWQAGKYGHFSDRSEFVWETPTSPNLKGKIDDSAPGNGRKSTAMDLYQTGTIATKSTNGIYVIKSGDVGGTIKFSLTAKDGAGITGNTETISHYLDKEQISTKKPPVLSNVRLLNSASGATQQALNSSYASIEYYYAPGENAQATDMSEMVWYLPDGSTKFSKINNTSTRWAELRRTNNINNMQIGDGIYNIKPEDLEKIIKVEMTPVDSDGIRGATVVLQNEIVYRQADAVAPKVSNLKINIQDGGEPRLGTALYGTYDYTAGRGHGWGQDRSYYEWRGARTLSGRAQSTGRTGSYIIRLDDVGKTISLSVTAHSEVLGPIQGNTESQSVSVQGSGAF